MAPTITFEACQECPNYWDGLPHARRALNGHNGDWRMSHTRIAKEFPTFTLAERYARRILGQRPGVPVEIYRETATRTRLDRDRVATVSRDALDRTWTDLNTWEPLI
jgi:hypothetical protein